MKRLFVLIGICFIFFACEKEEEPCSVAKISAQYLTSIVTVALQCQNNEAIYSDILGLTKKVCKIGREEKSNIILSSMCPMMASGMLQVIKLNGVVKYNCNTEVIDKLIKNPDKICEILDNAIKTK